MRSQNVQPTFCSASRHNDAVFFSVVSTGFYLAIKIENGRRQHVGLECVVAAIQFAHGLSLVALNLAVKVRLLWRHVSEPECFTVLDFQYILIGAGNPMVAIITTPYIGLQPGAKPPGDTNVRPEVAPSIQLPCKLRVWVGDIEHPWLSKASNLRILFRITAAKSAASVPWAMPGVRWCSASRPM